MGNIIVVDENVSLKPYLEEAKNAENTFEAQLEKLGFEVAEEQPARKIGFLEARERSNASR